MGWNDNDNPNGSSGRPNPWGKPGNKGDEKRPDPIWGQRPGQTDDLDIEALLNKARKNFGSYIPNNTGGNTSKILMIALVIAFVLWMFSGLYFVQPNENGVVLTFGKYTRTDDIAGPKWKLPWPIQSVQIVDVTSERRIQIGYNAGDVGFNRTNANAAHQESLMLTGDQNMVDINFVVLWRVGNAKDFLYSIRDPEDTISLVAASTMREIIGQNNIQPVLTDARTRIQSDARILMQKLLDEYHSGVTINNVQLQKVDPPAAVVDAFNEVQRARQKKEELKNLAEAYRNDIIPRAKGDAEKLKQDAEAYKQEVINRATGDAKRFESVLKAYKTAPDVTSQRMYIETIEEVLGNAKTIVLGDDGKNLTPYLPLNDLTRTPKTTTTP
ncbi:MAG: FtsH protease activity modulator HflK [Pseudobdellovibrionaceae bacterium]